MVSKKFAIIPTLLVCLFSAGCAHGYRFKDAPAVEKAGDNNPSPVPEKSSEFNFVEYSVTSSLRYPLVDIMDTRRKPRSQDVNSMDEVPPSTWFTPRIGAGKLSADEIVKGPEDKGKPQFPMTVIKVKSSGNSPGFIVKDARGLVYMIKLDRAEYPGIESGVNLIANRIFWALGYNVPEDSIIYFSMDKNELVAGESIDQDEMDKVLILSYAEEDGSYRAVASRFLEGEILGSIPQRGTRKNDPNDTINHENRRTLRALRMFCAWMNNSGIRSDNTLDVYTGEAGKGHTVHYLVDFGEAFGVHGLEKGRNWDSFEYFFSMEDMTRNFFTLGFPVKKWENLTLEDGDFKGNFESEIFHPGKWKESTQFMPIRSSLPDDDYWAAKQIASVTPEHLEALFKSADFSDKEYSAAVLDILLKRQEKVLRYAFGRVSPLEYTSVQNGKLVLEDLGQEVFKSGTAEYRAEFFNANSSKIAPALKLQASSGKIEVPVSEALNAAKGYLIIRVLAIRDGLPAPRPAEFHVRDSNGAPKVSGILH